MNPKTSEATPTLRRSLSVPLLLISALVAGLVVLVGPGSPATAQSAPAAGVYMPLTPSRILDTRNAGSGGIIAAQTSRDIQVTGLAGVPTTDVLAVVFDLSAVSNTSDGWGLLWQQGTTRPYPASSINYVPGRAVTNAVTVKVSATGKVSYFTWVATDLILDVVGYYRSSPGGGGYVPVTQTRVLDTRDSGVKMAAGSTMDRKLRGVAGVPDSPDVTAVAVNVSALHQDGPGFLTFWPKSVPRPGTSSLNFGTERMQTELVVATLSADGWTSIYNSTSANIHVLLDVVGYYTAGAGARFVPLTPTRIIDTRYHVPGWGIGPITQPLAPDTNTAIQLTGVGGVPTTGVSTVLVNAVAGDTPYVGWLNFWASGDVQPGTLSHTYYPNETTANLVMAKVGPDGKAIVSNYYGSSALVLDVVGYFSADPGPSAPTGVIAAPADQGATVAWGPPASNGGSAIDGYMVKVYKTTPTLSYVKETTTCATCTSTAISGLTNGQGYRFDVFARNSFGYGSSATSNVVTAGGPPDLLTPTTVEVTRGDGQATVTWTRPSLRLEGLTSYVVKIFAEASPTTVVSTTTVTDPTSTAVVTGLANGQSYFATVTASTLLVINVESEHSAPFVPAGAPFASAGVAAERGNGQVTISWTPPSDQPDGVPGNNGAEITGYRVNGYVSTSATAPILTFDVPANPTTFVVTGLRNGTPYEFAVRARNDASSELGPESGRSNSVVPAGAPFEPVDLSAIPARPDEIHVVWAAAQPRADGTPGDNGDRVVSQRILVSPPCPACRGTRVGGQDFTASITGLSPSTNYTFQVVAVNALGTSPVSTSATARTLDPPPPPPPPTSPVGAPSDIRVQLLDREARVTWNPPIDGSRPTSYTVTASPGGPTVEWPAPDTEITAVVPGLDNSVSYNFTVVAKNATGERAASSGTVPSLKARADAYMNGTLSEFLTAKELAEPPFEWSDDGCSVVDPDLIFRRPCLRHDFGYRNYGQGLNLSRTEDTRHWIDDILLQDWYDVCREDQSPSRFGCFVQAWLMHQIVRQFAGWVDE